MKLWWLADPVRLGAEKRSVERLSAEEGWFSITEWRFHHWCLSAEGIIIAHGVSYPVRLVYPDQFPSVPAWVEPQDPEAHWSSHQYMGSGTLCLELRPDNWTPDASGADVLRSAFNLLWSENPWGNGPHEQVPSAHWIGEIQSYDAGLEPALIGAGCLARILAGTAKDVRALWWWSPDNVSPLLISDAVDRTLPQYPASSDFGTLRHELPVVVGRGELPIPVPSNRTELAAGMEINPSLMPETGAVVAIAVAESRLVPFHSLNAETVTLRNLVVVPDEAGFRSGRTEAAKAKAVAVVGAGSVGSKVAEILIRSGVHRLVLADGDVLLPANLERHTLDWRDVGFRKVNGLRRRLLQIVPGAAVDVIPFNLDWQRSARMHAGQIERLAACDLIVDATGDVPTSLMLGALAASNAKPFVSVEVFEGGIGCLVARSIPGRDPAYVAGRAAYNAFCEERDVPPPPSGRRRYEALSEAGEPLVADDAAVTAASAHAARVVLDVLDGQVGEKDMAWLLIGLKAGWLFERHGDVISLDPGLPAPFPTTSDEDAEATAFVTALFKETLHAAKAPQ